MSKVFYSDTDLLLGLAASNRDAIQYIYTAYHDVLVKWVLSRGGLEVDAEDVFQEALVVLFEKSKSTEFCLTCKLSTYLFAICKRLWLKKIERSNTYRIVEHDENEHDDIGLYEDDLALHLQKEAQYQQLEKALIELGEPCAQLMKAFYIEKKSMQEIAATFNYTNAENAKTQKYKCLTRLKKIFFEQKVKA